jgi:hypothetical protein
MRSTCGSTDEKDACRRGVTPLEEPPRNNFELHFASVTAGLVNSPDTLAWHRIRGACFMFMCSSGRRFETGLALLNRCRALSAGDT